jgi:hypothetical protein
MERESNSGAPSAINGLQNGLQIWSKNGSTLVAESRSLKTVGIDYADMLIQSQTEAIENKEDQGLNSAKCGQVRQNPQTIRKQNDEKT